VQYGIFFQATRLSRPALSTCLDKSTASFSFPIRWAENTPRGAIDFAELSTTGDSLYGEARLEKLRKYFDRRKLKLRIDDPRLPADKGAGFIAGSKEILVRSNATKSQVWHELAHYLDYQRLGRPAYMNLPYPIGREQAAYNFLRNSRHTGNR
jgi:Metallopeptidase toxin 4